VILACVSIVTVGCVAVIWLALRFAAVYRPPLEGGEERDRWLRHAQDLESKAMKHERRGYYSYANQAREAAVKARARAT
jgi:hypothetical protein